LANNNHSRYDATVEMNAMRAVLNKSSPATEYITKISKFGGSATQKMRRIGKPVAAADHSL
jgi:hypothetical protein